MLLTEGNMLKQHLCVELCVADRDLFQQLQCVRQFVIDRGTTPMCESVCCRQREVCGHNTHVWAACRGQSKHIEHVLGERSTQV